MKKRVLSVLVAVALVACLFTSAMAATAGISAPVSVDKGETITVTLTMPALEGVKVATIQTKVNFNTDEVKLVEYVAPTVAGGSTMQSSVDEANANGAYTSTILDLMGENNVDLTKDIVWEAKFEVLDGVEKATFTPEIFFANGLEADGVTAIEYYTIEDAGEATEVKVVLPHEHTWVEKEGLAATCTEAGYTAYKECSECGAIEGQEVIKALGHDKVYGEWIHTGEVAEGEECKECTMERTVTCSRCDWTETETKAHNDNPATGDTMMSVLFFAMAAMFVAGIVVVNKARKNA